MTRARAIKAAKELYDNLPHNIRSLIYNYSTLEEAVNVFEVVEMIHNIGTVTLDSEETFADIDDAYKGLTDSEKLLVTNYGEYTEAKTEFLRLKLRMRSKMCLIMKNPMTMNRTLRDRL